MPKLTIDGLTVEVPAGKRLINAIETEGKTDQLHNCGGHAACTSCRSDIPSRRTRENDSRRERSIVRARLAGHTGPAFKLPDIVRAGYGTADYQSPCRERDEKTLANQLLTRSIQRRFGRPGSRSRCSARVLLSVSSLLVRDSAT